MIPGVRRKVTTETLRQFMQELAAAARSPGNIYLTGGATALLLGFREQTIDIDLKFDPEPKGVFEAIAQLKDTLNLNVELAAPDDFIPPPPDWREASLHITTIGSLQFFHYDLRLQALAKLERGHAHDLEDVKSLIRGKYVTPQELRSTFERIEPALIRYPAIDPAQFRNKLEGFLKGTSSE